MNQQFEWLQTNARISYPFEPVQPDSIKEAFVDALVIDGTQVAGSVKVTEVSLSSGSDNILAYYVESGNPFFSTTPVCEKTTYGEYTVARFSDNATNQHIVLLLKITEPFSVTFDGTFVTRCVESQPDRVNSITVYDQYNIPHTLTGDVIFFGGNNVSFNIGQLTEGARQATPVALDVIPGAGQGLQENDCTNDGYLRTINGVGPDEFGRYYLDARDCYRIWRPISGLTSQPVPNTLQMANGCSTCCECDDYGTVYTAMNRIYQTGRDTGKMLANLNGKAGGAANNARSDRAKRSRRKFKLLLRPTPGYILGVQVTYLNNQPFSINLGSATTDMRFTVTCSTPGEIGHKTIYIYNSRYEEWRQLQICECFPNLTECGGIYSYPVFYQAPTKYNDILGVQYAVTYFDLIFPDAAEGTSVTVELESMSHRWYYADTTNRVVTQTTQLIGDIRETS